jgi:mersacidin/lichenicidin family type 2 lantibiotic
MAIDTPDIIRAWIDEDYRRSLRPGDREQLPAHPAGDIALTDADIQAVSGNNPEMIEMFSNDCSGSCSDTTYCVSTGPCCSTEQSFTFGPCC